MYGLWQFAQDTIEFNASPDELGLPSTEASGGALDSLIGQAFIAIGAIAVIFVVIGALRYITSGGDAGKIESAKNTILYSIVGLVIAVSAFAIVEFVNNRIAQ